MSELNGPRQTVLITCSGAVEIMGRMVEKDNIIPVAWHMPASKKPLMYAIALPASGFSQQLIKTSGVFVVNFINASFERDVLFCSRNHGKHLDKFSETSFTKEDAESIECPRIKEAEGWIECEVVNDIETGDHTIFIGKEAHSELRSNNKRLYHITKEKFTTTVE